MLGNMSVKMKLSLAFGLIIVCFFAATFIAVTNMSRMNDEAIKTVDDRYYKVTLVNSINMNATAIGRHMATSILSTDAEELSNASKSIIQGRKENAASLDKLSAIVTTEKGKAFIAKVEKRRDALGPIYAKYGELVGSQQFELAQRYLNRTFEPANQQLISALNSFGKYQDELLAESKAESIRLYAQSKNLMLTIGAIAILISIASAFFIIRSLLAQLGTEPAVLANLALSFSKGDLNQTIPLKPNDKSSVSYSVSELQATLQALIQDADGLAQGAANGDLSSRADANKHSGDFRKIVDGMNNTLDALTEPLNHAANYMARIAKGDMPEKITEEYKGEFSLIKDNLNTCIDAVTRLIDDVNSLSNAAVVGQLSKRADTTKHQGDFRKVMEGINNTLDAVVTPLNVAASYVDNIAKGNIPAKITDTYNGDFNTLKDNLNLCIDNLNSLINEMNHMSEQHDLGDIDVMISVDKFQGAYANLAEGVNNMVLGHIAVKKEAMKCIEGFGEGDFSAPMRQLPGKKAFINKIIEQVRDNLKSLSGDVIMLSEAAAEGHVSTRADANKHQGDFRKIVEGFNSTLETIVNPIITVKEASEAIRTASNEIATGNTDLSQRTEKQATSLQETAASMEELASTVKQNADNAKQANQLSIEASSVAVKGGEVVNDVVRTMANINTSAQQIEDIISVIDGIAFQTNILALNAAVEAARAGEQGRGFAVVAGEVRNLAQRSSSAAKEIKDLITDSVTKTREGTQQVESAGQTMSEIVLSVQRVTDIIAEITAASIEQSQGIDQVNIAVTQMDETTQQNSALVEESAAAAESLLEQANALNDAVAVFKLDNTAPIKAAATVAKSVTNPAADLPIVDRRSKNSPLRNKPAANKSKSVASTETQASSTKTGTDDNDWEEF